MNRTATGLPGLCPQSKIFREFCRAALAIGRELWYNYGTINPSCIPARAAEQVQRERKYTAMIKLCVGVKGTGKTKTLIDETNKALSASKGNVVCLEKGAKLRYDISYQVRLINTDEYLIGDASGLGGFVAGILASNSDVTDLFVDSALKICGGDLAAFDRFLVNLDKLTKGSDLHILMTVSLPVEEATETMKKFM